jgi:membrane glycosyltransferase
MAPCFLQVAMKTLVIECPHWLVDELTRGRRWLARGLTLFRVGRKE